MTQAIEQVLGLCPEPLSKTIRAIGNERLDRLEEIRLRAGQPVCVNVGGREWALDFQVCDGELLNTVLGRASSYSGYAIGDQLSQGFLTVPGGHRIGVCGSVRPNGTMTGITSLNIRVARQITGIAEPILSDLKRHPASTLILGPPGSGKTTLLRETVRCLSDRMDFRVSLIDERYELAGVAEGVPQFSVGRHTDILSGVGKRQGIEMALRGMNPQWIALDEITAQSDVEAMTQAAYCGVQLLATAHASSAEDLDRRPVYRGLLSAHLFETMITIEPDRHIRAERIRK